MIIFIYTWYTQFCEHALSYIVYTLLYVNIEINVLHQNITFSSFIITLINFTSVIQSLVTEQSRHNWMSSISSNQNSQNIDINRSIISISPKIWTLGQPLSQLHTTFYVFSSHMLYIHKIRGNLGHSFFHETVFCKFFLFWF